jgi:hypothetical protein
MTSDSPQFDPRLSRDRWVACFDLLGIRALVRTGNLFQVFCAYADAQKEARRKRLGQVSVFWFSDSFFFYTDEGSKAHFWAIESVSRWFCHFLVLKRIPARGAISYGAMYSDPVHSLFFGQGLIDAYDYAEAQNWIGFILTPSAAGRLRELGIPPDERINYAYWQIPFKGSFAAKELRLRELRLKEQRLPACLFAGAIAPSTSRNFCLEQLASMKANEGAQFAVKYDNTIEFLNRNVRHVVQQS